jgi:5-methylcytosine-specific restriction endonuclease McrA
MQNVIVLNADMSILGSTNWKRAMNMVVSGKAQIIKDSGKRIHKNYLMPLVIRLIKAIRNLWRTEVPWTKNNIHIRDNFICQYCGKKLKENKVTIDHIIPVSLGGKNRWDNTVTSCFYCNNKKDNRTPSQAKMTLKTKPYEPTIQEFLNKKIKRDGLEKILKELNVW